MDNLAQHDEIVSQFCAMTGVQASEAQRYLAASEWDIEAAVTEFFTEQDESMQDADSATGHRLDTDEPSEATKTEPTAQTSSSATAGSSSTRKRAVPTKKFATMGDFQSHSGADSSDDDGSDDQDFFAGGEKSGLAVQNPDELKRKILEKARRAQPPPQEDSHSRPSHFTGTARTLGGDDAPSRVIQDSTSPAPSISQRVQRTLHFWADGFSVDDGDLYESADPRNAEILEGIRQGRAPLGIMNVQAGQEVDVELKQHEEKYSKPKPQYKPFSGSGQRLGSPTPAVQGQVAAATPSVPTSTEPPKPEVDDSQPTVTIQIRLGDGTRMVSRFNTTATIGDVYGFVSSATTDSQSRAWVLMTTFPSQELIDKSAVLGDLAEFKRGGVIVQKWS